MRQGANITLAALAGATTALNLESGTVLAMTIENQEDYDAGMNALLSMMEEAGPTLSTLSATDDIESECGNDNKAQHVGLDYQVATNWPEGLEQTVTAEGGFGEKNKITTHEFDVPAAVYRFKDYFYEEHTIDYPENSC